MVDQIIDNSGAIDNSYTKVFYSYF